MSLLTRYAELLRGTGAAPALAASLIARLALGTTGLALLLTVRESTGSYAVAGIVAAAYAASFAVFAPVRARRADRRGPRGVLLACALTHPAVLVALVLLAGARAGTAVLVGAAVLAGATVPPVGGVMRALWAGLVEPRALPTAYSLEAVVIELCFVGGPLLVAGLTAVSGPSAALLAAGVMVLVGGSWLAATPALRAVVPHARPVGGRAGPLHSAAVRSLLLTTACVGTGFGALEVAIAAFAGEQAARASTAGVLLAIWSAGSIAGGLAYGAVRPSAPAHRQLPWLVGALGLATALPLLATGPVSMAVLLVVYGLTIAPFSTCNSVLLGSAAPPGTATEAFAWSGSMIFGGAALGNAVSGALVDRAGATSGLLLTAGTGLLAAAAVLRARPALRPAAAA